ncbi:MAG: hydrogenase subunit MbhD domain-containing protein [Prochlorothrix sp.]|nr:hydrogenase subunit MbhD domain-containing protein [Prochlorothrix sp.]
MLSKTIGETIGATISETLGEASGNLISPLINPLIQSLSPSSAVDLDPLLGLVRLEVPASEHLYIGAIVFLLPLTALMTVSQVNPYHALVIRGILGAVAALVYALFGAADVALTEALVGTMLSITLYAVAVRSSLTLRLGVPASYLEQPLHPPAFLSLDQLLHRFDDAPAPLPSLQGTPVPFPEPDAPVPASHPLAPLVTPLQSVLAPLHLRIEWVPYPDRSALDTALQSKEIHGIAWILASDPSRPSTGHDSPIPGPEALANSEPLVLTTPESQTDSQHTNPQHANTNPRHTDPRGWAPPSQSAPPHPSSPPVSPPNPDPSPTYHLEIRLSRIYTLLQPLPAALVRLTLTSPSPASTPQPVGPSPAPPSPDRPISPV